ncbi:hypothetical protein EVAR_38752_1 [Eumeta japonica]|uniref:Uncharacterized protein n=1 Tax=Eumeta variegata TaxID=151549 RepID=A0A4C1WIW9_EUMVA|nr:hypothetical protein EVAR_38752_1 [Eumeta japonica]
MSTRRGLAGSGRGGEKYVETENRGWEEGVTIDAAAVPQHAAPHATCPPPSPRPAPTSGTLTQFPSSTPTIGSRARFWQFS